MLNNLIKIFVITTFALSTISCSSNTFARREGLVILTLGLLPGKSECEKRTYYGKLGGHAKRYDNGVNPSRTCVHYQEYLCHTNITCKKHQDKEERRKCELDAESYFLKSWQNKEGNFIDRVDATKRYCDRIKKQCDAAPKDDYSCRR